MKKELADTASWKRLMQRRKQGRLRHTRSNFSDPPRIERHGKNVKLQCQRSLKSFSDICIQVHFYSKAKKAIKLGTDKGQKQCKKIVQATMKSCSVCVNLSVIIPTMTHNKVTSTHQVPVSLTHSERQRHFSFWSEQLDLMCGHRNHSQPVIDIGLLLIIQSTY